MSGKLKSIISGCAVLFFSVLAVVFAGAAGAEETGEPIAGPGWFSATADPVSPEEADAYYASISAEAQEPVSDAVASMQSSVAPEIAALAKGLRNDPKLIFDYVHNHIDYVPYFGALKGAVLTYLDGSGNDFDQAALLVELLRAGGISANYVYGKMTIPGKQLANWMGVDWLGPTDGDKNIGKVVPSVGIPLDPPSLRSDGTATIARVWVVATINGKVCLLDPAFKNYEVVEKIDLGHAMGYVQADIVTAAGGTVTTNSIQNVNETSLASKLSSYSTTLVNTIKNQYPNREIKEIIGGRSIVAAEVSQFPTTLPFPATTTVEWDQIPADKIATLRIQHLGIDRTLNIPDLAGKRLTLTYTTAGSPRIWLDGILLVSSATTKTLGSKNDFKLSINHPYANDSGKYVDQESTYKLNFRSSITGPKALESK